MTMYCKEILTTCLFVSLLTACGEPEQWKKPETTTKPSGIAPLISSVAQQSTPEDTIISNITFTMSDADSNLTCQSAKVTSGNSALVVNSKIFVSGTVPNCSISINPEANKFGFVDLKISASDNTNNVTVTNFTLEVTPVNDAPVVAGLTKKTTLKNMTSAPIAITFSDIDSVLSCASLSVTSSNQAMILNSGISINGTYPNCTFTVTPVSNQIGLLELTATVTDGALTHQGTFEFEILDSNLPPTISQIADISNQEDFTAINIPFTINDSESSLSCASSVTSSSSNTAVVSTSELVLSGSAPNCNLQISSKLNAYGSTQISLTVSDGIFTASESFTLNIEAVNDAPVITPISQITMSWNSSHQVPFSITDIDSTLTCSSPHLSATSSNLNLLDPTQIVFSGTAPNCIATLTPSPGIDGTSEVSFQVSDGIASSSSSFTLSVEGILSLNVSSPHVVSGGTVTFSAVGGSGTGYSYSIDSGGGSINSSSGVFTAAASAGSVTVRVTDSLGNTATETVEVYEPLSISPLTTIIAALSTANFTGTGGYGALNYSVSSGNGTVSSLGVFTASSIPGSSVVTVQDTLGNTASASVTVVSLLTISPTSLDLPVFSTAPFIGGGGQTAYSFSLTSGLGSIDSATGILTAPATTGTATVELSDQSEQKSQSAITYIEPTKITSGLSHSCALYNNGRVKCWGSAANGKLGQENTTDLGDTAGEVGGALPFVNLGSGRTAIDISAGADHTCAVLENGDVKCWGLNSSGQLGYGDIASRGDQAGEMGNSLPVVSLGSGRSAKAVVAGTATTCAILDNNSLKCWGAGTDGILGTGGIANIGDGPSEMGDLLNSINLGTGRTVKKVALAKNAHSACAILDNDSLKCWGANTSGRLGYGDTNARGDNANEMGNSLPVVDLGTGKFAVQVSMGNIHNCALLNDNTVKCWGEGGSGRTGMGSQQDRGDGANEMGNNLPVVDLGTGFTPAAVESSETSNCVISTTGTMKCFGLGTAGIRLSGDTTAVGQVANKMGDALLLSDIGTETISKASMGFGHACSILSNKRIKCWGAATGGALLNLSTSNALGDVPGEIGVNLPFLNH